MKQRSDWFAWRSGFAVAGQMVGAVLGALLCLVLLGALAPPAAAQDDPPGRVGRIAALYGSVLRFDADAGRWVAAERNRPLLGGDRLSTADDGRAELQAGSSTLRLGTGSELEVLRLDDERMVFQLHSGTLALRLRANEVAGETQIVTAEATLLPQRAGYYRVDRIDDRSDASVWRGEWRVAGLAAGVVGAGQRAELYRDGAVLRMQLGPTIDDEFAAWALREDRRDEQRSAAQRYVSPEMTGGDDLERYGSWAQSSEYGPVWLPRDVAPGWAPYREGRWVWVAPWGWTWVDDAPWGFAPFHYGRWVWWRDRWGWCPGAYVARPVFAPALVAWVGGAGWSVGIQVGAPVVGWVPLAPREVYVPWFRHTPRYGEHVNRPWQPEHRPPPRQVPTGPIMYTNQGVPGGVTVVPRDVLVDRLPVGRAVVEPRDAVRRPLERAQPPAAPEHRGVGREQGPPGRMPERGPDRAPAWRGERPAAGGAMPQMPPLPLPLPLPQTPQTRRTPPAPQVQMVPGGAVPLPARPLPPTEGMPPPQLRPALPSVSEQGGVPVPAEPRRVEPQRREQAAEVIDLRRGRAPQTGAPAREGPATPPAQRAVPPAVDRAAADAPAAPKGAELPPAARPAESGPERATERAVMPRDEGRKRIPEPISRDRARDREAAR